MKETSIADIRGREILDSRGVPTVEAEVLLNSGVVGRAAVPSGASKGSKEAIELRDGDEHRYGGRGVLKAVGNVNGEIRRLLRRREVTEQRLIDRLMNEADGSSDGSKARLGANAILAVSLAAARAAAAEVGLELFEYIREFLYAPTRGLDYALPTPMLNFVNGGAHADNSLDFQEFLLVPEGAETFEEGLRWSSDVYLHLLNLVRNGDLGAFSSFGVGDEGGFSIRPHPSLEGPAAAVRDVLRLLERVVNEAGYELRRNGAHFAIALDPAASEFFENGHYVLGGRGGQTPELWSPERLVNFYQDLTDAFPVISIEDGMAESDIEGWKLLTDRLQGSCQIVGDDLFVTNPKLVRQGINDGIANAVVVKVNQIGTLSEALEVVELAQQNNYATVISHRSGETEDTTISDIAVAVNAGQIKSGCLSRADRVAKYNRLLEISAKLGHGGFFWGRLLKGLDRAA